MAISVAISTAYSSTPTTAAVHISTYTRVSYNSVCTTIMHSPRLTNLATSRGRTVRTSQPRTTTHPRAPMPVCVGAIATTALANGSPTAATYRLVRVRS